MSGCLNVPGLSLRLVERELEIIGYGDSIVPSLAVSFEALNHKVG